MSDSRFTEVQDWFVQALAEGKQKESSGEVPRDSAEPSDTIMWRREACEISNRLAVKPRILEARRKIKDIWKPRVAELTPLLEPQLVKLSTLKEKTEGHAPSTYHGRGGRESHHCLDCADLDIVQQNVDRLQSSLEFAQHNLDAQTRENERLTKQFDSVTGKDRKRLAELDELIEAATKSREPEKRIKVPPQANVNAPTEVRRHGFGSNGMTSF
jgi:hypothetical protein